MNKLIELNSCCLDKSLPDNTANCCLNTKVLRYGECKLSGNQVKDFTFILAHDLLEYANNKGDNRAKHQPCNIDRDDFVAADKLDNFKQH